uniref:Bombyxin B-9-like n=1 Tax=Diabrotica virgifera virgifera TaxID=50390 RepID=A0A6P7FEA1_DIAVI
MQLKCIFLLCALVFSFYYVNGQLDVDLGQRYCGTRLVQMLKWVCLPRMKRSLGMPGIVQECCFKRCTLDTMREYCD